MRPPTSILATLLVVAIFAVVCLLASVLAAANPATCRVECDDGGGIHSLGSGVLVVHGTGAASHVSLVATAAHVVQSARVIRVRFEGTNKRIVGQLAGIDEPNDVAIIQIPQPADIQPAPIRTDISVGDSVIREGYPRAGPLRVVRAAIRSLSGRYSQRGRTLVQVNTTAISGESGGPVYDSDGRVVALVCTTGHNDSQGPSGQTILDAMPHENWRLLAVRGPT